jgi:8-oxo-dGTP pyrophosphatase MutT (NUDIX family)
MQLEHNIRTREKVFRAGLIPIYINPTNIEQSIMMFMIPSDQTYGGSSPQIAKGQIEQGEQADEAAMREAHEELGLNESNIYQLIDCGTWLGRTHMFVALVYSADANHFDTPHFETHSTMWLTMDEFKTQGRDIHIPVVEQLFNLIISTMEK